MLRRRLLRPFVVISLLVASLSGVTGGPTRAQAATVVFVGASSAESHPGGTGLTVSRPAGTEAGHVLVATLGIVDDDPDFESPPGWVLVRADHLHDRFRQNIYVKVAGSSEPDNYTWTMAGWRRVAGGIVAYAGVDGTNPVAAHSGLVHSDTGTDTAAPSIVAPAGSKVVHLAVTNSESAMEAPAGMTERWEAAAWRAASSRDVTMSASDETWTAFGATGPRHGTASVPGARAGALLALRPGSSTAPPGSGITVVGSASNGSPWGRKSITIDRPVGTVAGDVMVAALASVDDDPSYQAPAGWTRLRSESIHDRLRIEVLLRVAGSSEPPDYTWTLSDWRRIAGGITAFRGVDAADPVDDHAASAMSDTGTAVTVPSITTSLPGAMLVHLAAVNAETALSPPSGMNEGYEAGGWREDNGRDVTLSGSSALQPAAGPTGSRAATSSVAGRRIGVLVALRPDTAPAPDETPPETTITSGPSGTVSSAMAEFTFESSEPDSTFECRLDGGSPEECRSPATYPGLPDGQHTFDVTAIDPAANRDPSPATRTWTIDSEPSPPAAITVVGSASDSSPWGRKTITISRPAGTAAGDVMVAALASVDDDPSYAAPPGWTRVRSEMVPDRLRVEVFTKAAVGSEPADYTWTLPDWRRIAGGITSFRGVHTSRPVDVHNGTSWPGDASAVTAPSVDTSAPGTMLIHVGAVSGETTIAPAAGMAQDWEAQGWRTDGARDVTISAAHALQPAAGATGPRTAMASPAGPGAGVLLALLPSDATPAATDPYVPIGTFPWTEASGVVASRQYPGVVWTQRDSGDGVRNVLYAFRVLHGGLEPFPNGELYKAFPVPGTTNLDWEDIAISDDGYIYVGEIGNNSASRTTLAVYKVREPDPYLDTSAELVATYPFRYPSGNYDAESLFVHDGTLYLINKVGPPVPHTLFRLDTLTPGVQTTLVEVGQVGEPEGGLAGGERITGADLSPDGRSFVVVTGFRNYLYAAPAPPADEAGLADLVGGSPVWSVTHRADGSKEQVEAVTFLADGSLVTASEFEGRIRHVDSRLRPEAS